MFKAALVHLMIAMRDEAHLTLEISLAAIFSVEMLSSSRMYGRHPRVGAFMERTAMDLNILWIVF